MDHRRHRRPAPQTSRQVLRPRDDARRDPEPPVARAPLSRQRVIALQRSVGNQGVLRALRPHEPWRHATHLAGRPPGAAVQRVVEGTETRPKGRPALQWRFPFLPAWLNQQVIGYEPVPKATRKDASSLVHGDSPSDPIATLKDLHLNTVDLTAEGVPDAFARMTSLETLELTSCVLPESLVDILAALPRLTYLAITSSKSSPGTDLGALTRLKILRLVRCEFMTVAHYQALARLKGLSYLDLTRTITLEKAPSREGVDKRPVPVHGESRTFTAMASGELHEEVLASLQALASSLGTLDLSNCTALSEQDVAALGASSCRVIWSPSKAQRAATQSQD